MPNPADLNAIYGALGEIKGTVEQIRENQRVVKEALEKTNERLEGRVDRHERAIVTINNKINWGTGLVTAFGLVIGWFGKATLSGGNPL